MPTVARFGPDAQDFPLHRAPRQRVERAQRLVPKGRVAALARRVRLEGKIANR
jgi:hypothetical protein